MTRQFQNFSTGVCLAKVCKDLNLKLTQSLKNKFNYFVARHLETFFELVIHLRSRDDRKWKLRNMMQSFQKYIPLMKYRHSNLNLPFHDVCTKAMIDAINMSVNSNRFLKFHQNDHFDHIMRYYCDRLFTLIVKLEVEHSLPKVPLATKKQLSTTPHTTARSKVVHDIFLLAKKAARDYKRVDTVWHYSPRHSIAKQVKRMEEKKECYEILSMVYGNLRCEI